MKNKLIFAVLILVLLLFSLSSCRTHESSGKLSVVTTNFAMYDFARAVCGEECDVTMLLTPGTESHDFEATLEDIARISSCDVFAYVGGESEEWVYNILDSLGADGAGIKKICALDLVELLAEADDDAHENEHDHEHFKYSEYDEHVWTSIPNAITIMRSIADTVIECSGADGDKIRENLGRYTDKLLAIDADIRKLASEAERNTIIIADRFPFNYFAAEYGFSYIAAFSGCSSSTEPSLNIINSLISDVKREGAGAIFTIEFSDRRVADIIARETGTEILSLSSAHNVTRGEFESGTTYADLMVQNLEALRTALK